MLGAERERLPVRLPEVEEVALVALKDRPRDLLGVDKAADVGPAEEEAEVGLAVLDRSLGVAVDA